MAKKVYTEMDLVDFVEIEAIIECSNCNQGDMSWDETCEDFFNKGWRATKQNVYCPECAKKKLKL